MLSVALVAPASVTAQERTIRPVCDPIEREQRARTKVHNAEAGDRRVLSMCAHHANYVALTTNPNPNPAHDANYGYAPHPTELKLQVSLKAPVFPHFIQKLAGDHSEVWVAYTQTAWWQIAQESAPFRESNFEPEIFFERPLGKQPHGFDSARWRLGYVHQSNGKDGTLSRSWDRIRLEMDLERGAWGLRARVWERLGESPVEDDNPRIYDYLGYSDVTLRFSWGDDTFSIKVQNLIGTDTNRGYEINWQFHSGHDGEPVWFLHVYHGYGESLIDHDYKLTRVGIGLMLGDVL
jgi:phospholipase A1